MSTPKQQRQLAARQAAVQRTAKRLFALSVAYLRAEDAYDQFRENFERWQATGESDTQAIAGIIPALRRVENTPFTRASEMLSLYLSLLYAVVERWQRWKFHDAVVDQLLQSSHVQELEAFRHTIFHADSFEQMSKSPVMTDQAVMRWCREVATAFHDALLDWHHNLSLRAAEHIVRTGQ
jgi:hypothetical protein